MKLKKIKKIVSDYESLKEAYDHFYMWELVYEDNYKEATKLIKVRAVSDLIEAGLDVEPAVALINEIEYQNESEAILL